MAYFLDLFTPDTWSAFREHGAQISGFRERQLKSAQGRINVGDTFLCYLVRLSRWCGALQITSDAFLDNEPIFQDPDPFVVRFKVEPIVLLEPKYSLPIIDESIWNVLSETKDIEKGSQGWAMKFRGSLRQIEGSDGQFLLSRLRDQDTEQRLFEFTKRDLYQLRRTLKVPTLTGEVSVDVPEIEEDIDVPANKDDSPQSRQSITVQAKIAEIGAKMGFRIWVPDSDKGRVLLHIADTLKSSFLDKLPLSYVQSTLRTIKQIDVIWLKGRSMARAFEIEHTTAVYSGLLRMADLLALQPNMDIRLHIVAPGDRREKVLEEIRRPVFSLLDRGPLYGMCTYLSYDSVEALGNLEFLRFMNHAIIEEYEEWAED